MEARSTGGELYLLVSCTELLFLSFIGLYIPQSPTCLYTSHLLLVWHSFFVVYGEYQYLTAVYTTLTTVSHCFKYKVQFLFVIFYLRF